MKKRRILNKLVPISLTPIVSTQFFNPLENTETRQTLLSSNSYASEPMPQLEKNKIPSLDFVISYPQKEISTAEVSYDQKSLLLSEDYSHWVEIYRSLMSDLDESEDAFEEQIEKDLKKADYPEFIEYLLNHSSDEFKSVFINTWLADGAPIFNKAYYTALKICQKAESRDLAQDSTDIMELYAKHFEGIE